MKTNKLILLGCLISFFSQAKWEEVSTPSTENLTSIEFIYNIGFCAGENGVLLKSQDGGKTWNAQISGTSDDITSIMFLDSSTGYFSTSTGYIYRTINGGSSWENIQLQTGGIMGVDFLNDSIGLAVGDNGAIFRTSNGGDTWSTQNVVTVYRLNDVTFINDTLAVAVGVQGSILSSSDAGLTWGLKQINSSKTFTAIEKINNAKAAIIGESGLYSEFNAATMLASNTQTIDNDPNPDLLMDIHLSTNGFLYVVGFNQTILIANPGWKKLDLDSINNLNSVHFINDTIGFACGFNGKIYRTITGGFPVGKKELKLNKLNLYPNPSVNVINFIGLKNEKNKLLIYNHNGKLIINTLINQPQYNIEGLKIGFYFINIIGLENTYSGKFLKQ